MRIIADALGWPYDVKGLAFQAPYVLGKPRFRSSLYHVDQARSAPLEPPWPDLILTVGRRPSMAALWVKEQTQGRAALVVVGRPKRWLDRFDLVIAPPQFQLPRRANVLRLDLPLMRVDEAAIAAAGEAWRDAWPTCRGRSQRCWWAARPSRTGSIRRSPGTPDGRGP